MDFFNFFRKRQQNCWINCIELVIKITDYKVFDEEFANLPRVQRVQPHWEYFSNKGIIKIDLGGHIVAYLNKNKCDFSLESLFEIQLDSEYLVTVDLDLFKSFGIPFINIDYRFNNKDYINFYYSNQTIKYTDFTTKNFTNEGFLKRKAFLMMLNDNQYINDITSYVKSFLNNSNKINTEIILLNYAINISLNKLILKVI
jgi:hypothetical protein